MVDEFERIRDLADEAPAPDDAWVASTREDLLALARQERLDTDVQTEAEAGDRRVWHRLGEGLVALWRRPALAAAMAAVVLVAAAGGVFALLRSSPDDAQIAQPGEETAASAPATPSESTASASPSPSPAVELAASCTATNGTYTVRYPGDWHTNPGEALGTCEVFDEQPLAIEPNVGGGTFGAITFNVADAPISLVSEPGPASRRLSTEEVEVDGRQALRVLRESTGQTSLPAGMRSYGYFVDLGERTLVTFAYDTEDGSFERRQQVLDAMIETIDLNAP